MTGARGGDSDGYLALRAGRAVARLAHQVIWVEGPDAGSFLHGLLSNDLVGLPPGGSTEALMLDARGRVRALVRVLREGPEAFTLVVDPQLAEELRSDLDRYHFSEDLDILGPEPVETVLWLDGATPAPPAAGLPGPLPNSRLLLTDDPAATIAELDLPEASAEGVERARIAAGAPRVGIDTGPTTLVQELHLQDRAVSFTKGCYLGQETVARAQFRGKVNRALVRVRLDGPLPPVGAELEWEGRPVGTLTSIAATPDLGTIGLAIVRRTALDAHPPAGLGVADHPETRALPITDTPAPQPQ